MCVARLPLNSATAPLRSNVLEATFVPATTRVGLRKQVVSRRSATEIQKLHKIDITARPVEEAFAARYVGPMASEQDVVRSLEAR